MKKLITLLLLITPIQASCLDALDKYKDITIKDKTGKQYNARDILTNIASKESSLRPYTINVKGKGYYLKNKQDALKIVKEQINKSNYNFDVGCMQLNYKWFRPEFKNNEQMISPEANIEVAFNHIKQLAKTNTMVQAMVKYHSYNHKLQEKYRKGLRKEVNKAPTNYTLKHILLINFRG